jgi:hypothetical protein
MTSSSETHTSSPPHMPRISLRSSNDASNFQATRAPTVSRRPTRTQHLPELSRSTSTTRLPSHSTSTSTSTQTPRSVALSRDASLAPALRRIVTRACPSRTSSSTPVWRSSPRRCAPSSSALPPLPPSRRACTTCTCGAARFALSWHQKYIDAIASIDVSRSP